MKLAPGMDTSLAILVLAQALVLVVFMNRYVLGTLLMKIKARRQTVDDDFSPTVSIVVPLFNEGRSIYDTVQSLLAQDYDATKLDVYVVDDCSTDDSHKWAQKAATECPARVRVLKNAQNMGKRRSINHAVRRAESEIIVSVDSDVILDKGAVRQLVRRFTDDKIAAVGGRVNIVNRHDNWLTRMQAIKYFFGYEYLKNIERAFETVMCLSGCLTAYRRHVLLELEPILETRNIAGISIKYGEDRFLTRHIVKAGYKTTMTLDAISFTKAPVTLASYFSQQLRWRRSNLVDYVGGMSHVWKVHPVVAIHYFSLFGLMILYPLFLFSKLAEGQFWEGTAIHVAVVGVFGAVYRWNTRNLAEEERVEGIWFLPMAFVMPITYIILTPLAMFTLDSGSWETRGHAKVDHVDGDVDVEVEETSDQPLPGLPALVPETLPVTLPLPAMAGAAVYELPQGAARVQAQKKSLRFRRRPDRIATDIPATATAMAAGRK